MTQDAMTQYAALTQDAALARDAVLIRDAALTENTDRLDPGAPADGTDGERVESACPCRSRGADAAPRSGEGEPSGGGSRWGGFRGSLAAGDDLGMATADYAIATVAAAGFAGLLLVILRGAEVKALLLGIIRGALSV